MTQTILWIDSNVAYKVKSFTSERGKKIIVHAILQRIKPFPHLTNDDWNFTATIGEDNMISVNLDCYTQNQPNDDNK